MHRLWKTSHLAGFNAAYLEALYEHYLQDPQAVDEAWRRYFDSLPRMEEEQRVLTHHQIRELLRQAPGAQLPLAVAAPSPAAPPPEGVDAAHAIKQCRVGQLVDAYRADGHLIADFDPLTMRELPPAPRLEAAYHGLDKGDFDTLFETNILGAEGRRPLREIIAILRRIYCGHIGVEYMHIPDEAERAWIRERIEPYHSLEQPADIKRRLLQRLTAAEGLERYLHTKYMGQKRFSLEGAESLIPLLEELIQRGGGQGLREIVIGMAHRGRLNVLVNIMGKSPMELFEEFEGKVVSKGERSGDVKYHLGFSSNIDTPGGALHVSLAFNPSHLEIADPVVEGSARARQERRKDREGSRVVSILIHGDAAFSGQGVVMETFNMSQSRGYSTKGTIHIIVNNQIGFTTSNQKDARSTLYCSDLAKMVNAPIFHVNSDDPEAVFFVSQLALDYRMCFRKDVVIDLVCYRRHGHSEVDEPAVTQPLMVKRIKSLPTARELYARRLLEQALIAPDQEAEMVEEYRAMLDAGQCTVPYISRHDDIQDFGLEDWTPYLGKDCTLPVPTCADLQAIRDLTARMTALPQGFELHPSVAKIFDNRRKMAAGALPIDWGYAENLAYATLVSEGHAVRLSGQDSGRGTFFHRHAVVYCQKDGNAYVPLRHLDERQANFLVTNSLLSEEAVLAFEYGYATTDPKTLVIWEAQFGDFANNAQVVIDQFISAGEQKWDRLCGLVMFLPHGYEGQGPEHSSARLERYLQLCAERNMQVCVPTTPAQMFHLLRRQVLMSCRKPLIVMTPKSLLRHKQAVSTLEDLSQGGFQALIPECDEIQDSKVRRVIMCSGKVYYDLLEKRRSDGRDDIAIIRMEQLYPFPKEGLRQTLRHYRHAREYIWCQEEPMNQGAWYAIQHNIREVLGDKCELHYAGRLPSAAPAVGYPLLHIKQLCAFLEDAIGPPRRQADAAQA
ncbi:MAG: 2-oxoglutarate dehydrogenase E1 component [Gammaproteobacteria bacterium]